MLRKQVVRRNGEGGYPMRKANAVLMITFIVLSAKGFDGLDVQESGKSLLERVEQTYNSLASYQFEGTISSQTSTVSGVINIDVPFEMAAIKPDRVRLAIKNPPMGLEFMSIASGTTTWEYWARQKQYSRKESKQTYAAKELSLRVWAVALGVKLPIFERITENLKIAEIIREESIEITGSKNCYVVEAEYDSPDFGVGGGSSHKTFWIDRDRFAVLKEISTETVKLGAMRGAETKYITTFKVVRLNEQLDNTLFIFTPPDGTSEVRRSIDRKTPKIK